MKTNSGRLKDLRVTVFGASSPRPGDEDYQKAYQLGSLLGSVGITVLTGGYMGTMEAVSRGAAEAGGHVIGVTCAEIEAWRPIGPNPWVIEEIRLPQLRERLYTLIDQCDAAIALPGGVGTLAEIVTMWSELQISDNSSRPLILVGEGWQSIVNLFFDAQGAHIHSKTRKVISTAQDVQMAFEILKKSS